MSNILDFDYVFYSRNNPDLNFQTEEEYRKHFYKHGFLEGRSGSQRDFMRKKEYKKNFLMRTLKVLKN